MHQTKLTSKIQMVCATCGSANVSADASARWDDETQEWELSATYDKGASCEVCEGECRIEEVPLAEWEAALTQPETISLEEGLLEYIIVPEARPYTGTGLVTGNQEWIVHIERDGERLFTTVATISVADAKDAARHAIIHEEFEG